MVDEPMCVCGHTLDEHHRVWYQGGYETADECEFYGFNETGGLMPGPNGGWVEHCQRFRSTPWVVDGQGDCVRV
jgi:hypothetical protein